MLLAADQTVVMLGATVDLEKGRKIHVSLRGPARGSEAPVATGSETNKNPISKASYQLNAKRNPGRNVLQSS